MDGLGARSYNKGEDPSVIDTHQVTSLETLMLVVAGLGRKRWPKLGDPS